MTHGTATGYMRHGCRCEDCRAAHTTYIHGRAQRWKARGLAPDDPRHGQRQRLPQLGLPPEPEELAAIVMPPTMVGMTFRLPYAQGSPDHNIADVKLGRSGPTVRCLVERKGKWLEFTVLPEPPTNPDCAAGKHQACSGTAWDNDADRETECGCTCHPWAAS